MILGIDWMILSGCSDLRDDMQCLTRQYLDWCVVTCAFFAAASDFVFYPPAISHMTCWKISPTQFDDFAMY